MPIVHENILRNVVTSLRQDYDVKVFFLLSIDDAPQPKVSQSIADEKGVELAVSKFKPQVVQFFTSQQGFDSFRRVNVTTIKAEWLHPPNHCQSANSSTSRLPHTLLRAQQCVQEIAKYESENGYMFDWVYRLRPDVIYFDNIISPKVLRRDVYYSNQGRTNVTRRVGKYWIGSRGYRGDGAIGDQIGMSSRVIAEKALRAWEAIEDCELYHMGFTPCPEDVLRFWLLKNNIRYDALPFDWVVMRENLGPECKRLFHQHGIAPHGIRADWKNSIARCFDFAANISEWFPLIRDIQSRKANLMLTERLPSDTVTE